MIWFVGFLFYILFHPIYRHLPRRNQEAFVKTSYYRSDVFSQASYTALITAFGAFMRININTVGQQGGFILGETTGSVRLIAFVLIVVGTLGLLANEFIAEWGRAATLASAALNLIGLVVLGYSLMRDRKRSGT